MNIIKYIGRQFAKPTGFGGKLSTFIMNRINQRQYKSIIDNIRVNSNNKILDIGFGNGYLLNKVLQTTNAKVYGIEVSEDMLKLATKKLNNQDIELLFSDINSTNFENDFFNIIYTVNTIYFWTDLKKGLEEIMRILKPDGVFLNAFYSKEWLEQLKYTNYDFKKYTSEDIIKIAQEVGFKEVHVNELKKGTSYCMRLVK